MENYMQTNLLLSPKGSIALFLANPSNSRLDSVNYGKPHGGVIKGDKAFLCVDSGVLILPADRSYKRFIRNSWYADINTDNL
jgi:hypothetical protein